MSYEDDIAVGDKFLSPDRRDELPKVNAPCPICWEPSHWANAAFNYVHPGCEASK